MSSFINPFARRNPALPAKSQEIKAWIKEAKGLEESVIVSVTEVACRESGCPDIETVIGIMRPGERIETIRVHKAIADLTQDDLKSMVEG